MCIGYHRAIINPKVRHHYPEVRMEVTTTPPKPDWLGPFPDFPAPGPQPFNKIDTPKAVSERELAAMLKLINAAKAVIDGPPAGPDAIEKHKEAYQRYEVALNHWKSIIKETNQNAKI